MPSILDEAIARSKLSKVATSSTVKRDTVGNVLAESKKLRLDIASANKTRQLEIQSNLDGLFLAQERDRDRNTGEQITDATVSVVKGATTQAGAALYELANQFSKNTIGPTAKLFESITGRPAPARSLDEGLRSIGFAPDFGRTNQAIDTLKSDPINLRRDEVNYLTQVASNEADALLESQGGDNASLTDKAARLFNQATGAVSSYVANPSVAVDAAIESIPTIVTGGALSKTVSAASKAKVAAVYIGATEGESAGSGVREQIINSSFEDLAESSDEYNELVASGETPERARQQLAEKGSLIATAITAPLAIGASKLTGTDKLIGNLFKPTSKLGKKLSNNFIVNTAKGAAREGSEELLQGASGEFASNVAKKSTVNPDQDLTEGVGVSAGTGLVVGSLAGGAISGSKAAVEDIAKGTAGTVKAVKKVKAKINDKVLANKGVSKDFQKAVKNGDLDPIINKEAKTVQDKEDKVAALLGTMPDGIDERREQLGQVLSAIVELSNANKEIEGKEGDARKQRLKQYFSEMKAFGQEEVKQNKDTAKEFVENLPDKATPEVSEQIATTLNTFGSSPRTSEGAVSETLAQAETLLKSGLTNAEQTSKLNDIIETLKTFDEVTSDIFFGDKKDSPGFKGINQHQEEIDNAIDIGNDEQAKESLADLKKFTDNHTEKLAQFEVAVPAWDKREKGGVLSQKETSAIEAVESRPSLSGKGKFKLSSSTKLGVLPAIVKEVAALQAALAESTNQLATPTAKPKASAPREQASGSVDTTKPTEAAGEIPESAGSPASTGAVLLKEAQDLNLKIPAAVRNNPNHKKSVKILKQKLDAAREATSTPRDGVAEVERSETAPTASKPASTSVKVASKADIATAKAILEPSRTDGNSSNIDRAAKKLTELLRDHTGKKGTASRNIAKAIKDASTGQTDTANTNSDYLLGTSLAKDFDLFNEYTLGQSVLDNSADTVDHVNKKTGQVVNKGSAAILKQNFTVKSGKPKSLLQTVRNLFRQGDKNDSVFGELTSTQLNALPTLKKFNKAFKSVFFTKVLKLRGAAFAYQDTFQYFIKAGAKQENLKENLDENLVSTMAMVALNWVATQGNDTSINNKVAINGMLNRDSKHNPTDTEYEYLKDVGTYQKNMIESMGKEILSSMGITVNKDAHGQHKSNLENALGNMALSTLLASGMVTRTTIPQNMMNFFKDGGPKPTKPSDVNVSFIRIQVQDHPKYDSKIPTDLAKGYMDAIRDSDGILAELFGIESRSTAPTATAPDEAPETIKNSFLDVPAKLRTRLKKIQKKPFTFHNRMFEIGETLGEEAMLAIAGFNFDYETDAHILDRPGIAAKNADILRNFTALNEFRELHGDKPFYFKQVVWKSMRMGLESNTVNPQTDKHQRFMLGMQEHEVTIDPSNKEDLEQFITAMAQGLGIGIDKNTTFGSMDELNEQIINNPDFDAGIRALQDGDNPSAVIKAVNQAGEDTHSLAAMVAYVDFLAADGKPFKTTLVKEVDGITNGVAIGLMQLMVNLSEEKLEGMLKRTGIFLDETQSYGEWIRDPVNLDAYQHMAKQWVERLEIEAVNVQKGRNDISTDGFRSLQALVGKMTNPDGSISGVGRKLIKNPLMITNYGAGIKKVIEAFTENRINNLYTRIATSVRNGDDDIYNIVSDINHTLGQGVDKVSIEEVLENPLEWVMPFNVRRSLERHIDDIYGETLKEAIQAEFGEFIDHRKELVKATSIMFEAFKLQYEEGYNKLVKAVDGNLPSIDSVEQLNEDLLDAMPMFKAFFSETNRDGILVMNATSAPADLGNARYKTDTRTITSLPTIHKNLNGESKDTSTKQLQAYANKPDWEDAGVAGPISAIHNLDAATMVMLLEGFTAINIHDAAIFSLKDTDAGGQLFNESFLKAVTDYSMNKEINDAFQKNMAKMPKALARSKEFASAIGRHLGKGQTLSAFMEEFDKLTQANEHARGEFIPKIKRLDQYTGGQGTTFNTEGNELGSNVGGIDINNFNADTEQRITAKTVEQVYDALSNGDPVIDTTHHDTHLRTVLSSLIGRVMDPLNLHMATRGKENEGIYSPDTGAIYMVNAISNGMSALSARMSQREVYVHELIHHITNMAIDNSTVAANNLNRLYKKVRDSGLISAKTFMEGNYVKGDPGYDAELKVAQERYDYIFGDKIGTRTVQRTDPVTGKPISQKLRTHHHEFLAFGITNAGFRKALSQIRSNDALKLGVSKQEFKDNFGETLWNAFTNLLNQLIDYVASVFTGTRSQTVNDSLLVLAGQLAGLDTRSKSKLWAYSDSIGEVYDLGTNKLAKASIAAYKAVLDTTLLKSSRFAPVRRVVKSLGRIDQIENVPAAILKIADYYDVKEENLATSVISELRGQDLDNTDIHQLGRESNKTIDQERAALIHAHSEQVLDAFHAELSTEESTALSKILLKTDISILFPVNADGQIVYDRDVLLKYLEDGTALNKEIDDLVNQLESIFTANGKWYSSMAINLGQMMATGRPLYDFVLLNANVIAQLNATTFTKGSNDNLVLAEKLIDRLATLKAIAKTDSKHKQNAATVIRREFAEDTKNNGVINVIEMNAATKAASMDISFNKGKDKKLAVKGYTKELLNPNMSFKTAPASHEAALKEAGYTKGHAVRKDVADPNPSEVLYMYTSTNGAPSTLQAGTVSFTNEAAKGKNTLDIYSDLGEFDPSKAAAMDKPYIDLAKAAVILKIAAGNGRVLKDADGSLIPTLDSDGNIANWRYMMEEHKKDTLLDKDNSVNRIVGATLASITDKKNTEIINNKTVALLHKQFQADRKLNRNTYVEIGPNAPSDKYKEVYHMLPQKMRDEIRRVTGTDSLYVKRDEASLIFGSRKFSVSQLKKVEIADLTSMELVKAQIHNTLVTVFGNRYSIIMERMFQELIRYVKDAIVIKSGIVLLGNFISNVLVLLVSGVSVRDMATNHFKGVKHAREFESAMQELRKLNLAIKLPSTKKGSLDVRIKDLQDIIDNSPIKDLYDAGVHQSIIEDIDDATNAHSYQSQLLGSIESNAFAKKVSDNTPAFLKTIGKNLVMTHDTGIYEFMKKTTQLSDFVARFVMHEHNKKKGVDTRESINMAVDLFINYDLPTHRYLQYANDMGFMMFTKFTLRIQKVIVQLAKRNPGGLLATLIAQEGIGDVADITDSLLLTGSLSNKVNLNPLELLIEILDAPLTVVGELLD